MAAILKPEAFLSRLRSPLVGASLHLVDGAVQCQATGKLFPVVDGVIDFVVPEELDGIAKGELEGNDFLQSSEDVAKYVHKYEDDVIHGHYTDQDIDLIVDHLRRLGARELCCLGAGGGMEVRRILRRYALERVFCSDIVVDKCKVVPLTLEEFNVDVGLFASDFDHCPWADLDTPVLIHQALHHTGEAMHGTLAALLSRGYRCLIMAEPTGNALIRALGAIGLAQRVEYSGVRPGRLQVETARKLAQECGYEFSIQTNWMFPKDYLHIATRGRPTPDRLAMKLVDGLSKITRPFALGNNSVSCFLRK